MSPRSQMWRHIFTAAAGGPSGAGFQTVASSIQDPDLHGEIEQALEDASEAAATERVHQARTLPGRPGLCLLSRMEPAGVAPDERHGNFWAESLLVPNAWLEQAQWDVAEAFVRIEFWGARELPDGKLEPEALPSLDPGSLDRLERVRRLAVAQRRHLLHAVAGQLQDRSPVFVVRPDDMDAADFRQLVLLLPLLLPPGRRVAGGSGRPIHLRTLGLAAGSVFQSSIDFLGVSLDQLEEATRQKGTVVDLRSQARSTRRPPGRSYADEYVNWLAGVLNGRRWDELGEVYSAAAVRQGDPIAGFAAPARTPPAAPATAPDRQGQTASRAATPLARQRPAWNDREQNEAEAATLRREIADDVRQLKATLEADFERQRQALEQAGAAHLRELDEAARQRIQDVERQSRRVAGKPARPTVAAIDRQQPPRPRQPPQGSYGQRAVSAWRQYRWYVALVVLGGLLAFFSWQTWRDHRPPGASTPASVAGVSGGEDPDLESSRFEATSLEPAAAWRLLKVTAEPGKQEPLWIAWSSASIGNRAACALRQMILGSAPQVDARCGKGTNAKLAARIKDIGQGTAADPEARLLAHFLSLGDECVALPLRLQCLPTAEQSQRLVELARGTAGALEKRIARLRGQQDLTAELAAQTDLQNLVLNVAPEPLDRLEEIAGFLLEPMLALAAERCESTVADSGDRYDPAALEDCLATLEGGSGRS